MQIVKFNKQKFKGSLLVEEFLISIKIERKIIYFLLLLYP